MLHLRSQVIRILALAAAAIGLAVTATACGSSGTSSPTDSPSSGSSAASITVGLAALWLSAPVYVAEQHGFFAAQHLNVKPVVVASTPAMVAAIQSGSMTFGVGSLPTEMEAAEKGIGIKIVAPNGGLAPSLQVTAVAAGSPITSPKQLVGKSYCVNVLNGADEEQAKWWLASNGVDYNKVHFIAIPFQSMVSALQHHEADVCDVVSPYAQTALAAKQITKIGDDNLFFGPYGSPATAYFGSSSYIAANPGITKRFVDAMMATHRYIASHPDAARNVLPLYAGVTAAQAKTAAVGSFPTSFSLSQLQTVANRCQQVGLLTDKLDVSKIVWSGAPGA